MDVHNQHPRDAYKQAEVVVIMVPFPCYSHLNQVLQLSCLISSYNIPVHYACSATHVHQAKLRFNATNRLSYAQIQFHEFPTPPFLSPPPDPNSKFPTHLIPSFEASLQLRDHMTEFLHKISPMARRVAVVHDVLMAYVVQDTATIPNTETYAFNPVGTFTSFFNGWQMMGKPFQVDEPQGLPSDEGCVPSEIRSLLTLQTDFLKSTSGTIINSCRSIEGTYIDLWKEVQVDKNRQIWAVGPLNTGVVDNGRNSNSQHKCLEWLDKQDPKSVLYVSFGTTTSLTNQQIKELAIGLEQSGQKFIWVLRDADKGDIFSELQEWVVDSSTIAEAVKKLMASREGEEMRTRAEELGGATRKAVEEGGVSRMELDSFIAHITR
ncbi:Zeatin O-glucosyltransferase [Camellia lanceoleosa]|uniref:Zeatin O-glucosyltransferase n=1 Tax=Camellia lanceoleosa TaxID=1840588 RepID=A0ACC0G9Q9_9ERIC|nr:Zeatin O-glucosyltransferase [Camellia lanceoleosa]